MLIDIHQLVHLSSITRIPARLKPFIAVAKAKSMIWFFPPPGPGIIQKPIFLTPDVPKNMNRAQFRQH